MCNDFDLKANSYFVSAIQRTLARNTYIHFSLVVRARYPHIHEMMTMENPKQFDFDFATGEGRDGRGSRARATSECGVWIGLNIVKNCIESYAIFCCLSWTVSEVRNGLKTWIEHKNQRVIDVWTLSKFYNKCIKYDW